MLLSLILLASTITLSCTALRTNVVSELIKCNQAMVDKLKAVAPGPSELFLLCFALTVDTEAEAMKARNATVAWRAGPGKSIVAAATKAVKEATRNPGE